MKRQPDRERFEVRYVVPDPERSAPWMIRVPVSWHRKKERAIFAARCAAADSSGDFEVQVVWTHPEDDQYPGGWLDNADVVWSTRRGREDENP